MIRKLKTLLILCFAMFLAAAAPAQGQNTINTFAGGGPDRAPALSATVPGPRGVAVDAAGNIYLSSDFISTTPYSNRIFLVDRTSLRSVLRRPVWSSLNRSLRYRSLRTFKDFSAAASAICSS
jgi:hypothetical protein